MRRCVVAVALLVSLGCYTMHPVAGQPLPLGAIVALSINDAGRVALGGQMGPEISEVEGRLMEKDSAHYVLSVQQIRLIRGGEQVWSGERIEIKSQYVALVQERKFSRGKTALLSTATVGILALAFRQGLLGSFSPEKAKLPPDTGVSIRYPRFERH